MGARKATWRWGKPYAKLVDHHQKKHFFRLRIINNMRLIDWINNLFIQLEQIALNSWGKNESKS